MDSKQIKRAILISLIIMCLSFQQFTRLGGINNIRAIQAVTLIATGMGLGIFVFNLALLIRNNK
ncbi:MAG: hypothetical protein ACXVPY_15835 [Bacteroidia bacterium]